MKNAIEVRGLTKKFGNVPVVKSLSFDVPEGRIVGFLGPQRVRENNDPQDDVRSVDARFRQRLLPWV